MQPMKAPVFILGTHRSGTTLLARMLSCHPDVFIQNEIGVHNVFPGTESKDEILKNINIELMKRHDLDIAELLEHHRKTIWGIKDPQFTEHLDSLSKFINDSKFILIIRDPRAVVNSYIENKWGLGTNVYTGAHRWQTEVNQQRELSSLNSKQFLTIRFEDLLTDAETVLKTFCSHIGTDFNSAMLSQYKSRPMYRENQSNINTGKPLNPEISKKWRQKLTSKQVSIIESVCSEGMKEYGYEPTTSPYETPELKKIYYWVHQKVIGELQIQYQLKRIILKKWLSHLKHNA